MASSYTRRLVSSGCGEKFAWVLVEVFSAVTKQVFWLQINNPDMRIVLLRDYVKKNFPAAPILDYAFEVEKITTKKKPNLILNVDGFIAVSFLDLFRSSGCFTREEADEYVEIGILNGIFVLGRSMGFIGKRNETMSVSPTFVGLFQMI